MRIEDIASGFPALIGRARGPVVAVVPLVGTVGMMGRVGSSFNLASVASRLGKAFSTANVKAVALSVNCPGGSPVQSALIAGRIRALADEKEVPVIAFAEDVAASGGYMIAIAADEIFANESSIIGSIGVVSAGFGFDKLIEKIGIERRLYTAGERKAILDPFRPEDKKDVERLKVLQKTIHEHFKGLVRERRGDKLQAGPRKLFSGEFWTGQQALDLGLIDGLGDLRSIMRARYGEKLRFKTLSAAKPWLRSKFGIGASLPGAGGAPWADDLIASLDARAHWARFGL